MTTTPASLLQIDDRVGTIRPGTLANLVVTDGELFDEGTKVLETWVAGQQFVIDGVDEQPLDSVVGTWELEFDADVTPVVARMTVRRQDRNLTAKLFSLPGPTDSDEPGGDDVESDAVTLRDIVRSRDRFTAVVDLNELHDELPAGEAKLTFVTIDNAEGPVDAVGRNRLGRWDAHARQCPNVRRSRFRRR